MVLTVPLGQLVEERLDGVEQGNLLRVDIHDDVRLRRSLLTDFFTLGSENDAVQRLLCQRPIVGSLIVTGFKLYLSVQLVAAEQVVITQELLDDEHVLCLGIYSLPMTALNGCCHTLIGLKVNK